MKNSKSGSKSKMKSESKYPAGSKKNIAINSGPGEEEIRERANEIYLQRIELGEQGSAENDWLEAEKYFRDLEG